MSVLDKLRSIFAGKSQEEEPYKPLSGDEYAKMKADGEAWKRGQAEFREEMKYGSAIPKEATLENIRSDIEAFVQKESAWGMHKETEEFIRTALKEETVLDIINMLRAGAWTKDDQSVNLSEPVLKHLIERLEHNFPEVRGMEYSSDTKAYIDLTPIGKDITQDPRQPMEIMRDTAEQLERKGESMYKEGAEQYASWCVIASNILKTVEGEDRDSVLRNAGEMLQDLNLDTHRTERISQFIRDAVNKSFGMEIQGPELEQG